MVNIFLISVVLVFFWRKNPRALVTKLSTSNVALHLFLASTLFITLLAFMQGGTTTTMPLHFLGLASITLVLGRSFAILSAMTCALVLLLTQKMAIDDAGALLLGGMLLPIMCIDYWRQWLISSSTSTWRFVLYAGVGGAILSLIVKTLLLSVYYYGVKEFSTPQIIEQYLQLSLLFLVPEIMLNGTIILTLVQHKPHWIATYNTAQSNSSDTNKRR